MNKRKASRPQPEIELHIDLDDDRVIEAVANLLLDLTRPRDEPQPQATANDEQAGSTVHFIPMNEPQPQPEVVFLVEESPQGGFTASAVGVSIYTQADTLDGLRANVREAVECHYEPGSRPQSIRLRIVREEVLPADG